MSLVETDWLQKNIDKVKVVDCSWHMPQTKRDGFKEYKKQHIPNAIFFDLDDNSKKDTHLPHMLVEAKKWEKIVSNMGISKKHNEFIGEMAMPLPGAHLGVWLAVKMVKKTQ